MVAPTSRPVRIASANSSPGWNPDELKLEYILDIPFPTAAPAKFNKRRWNQFLFPLELLPFVVVVAVGGGGDSVDDAVDIDESDDIDGVTNGTSMAGLDVDSIFSLEYDEDNDDDDDDGSAEIVGIVGKFCIRLTSNSTNTASGCTCRTNVPAKDAETSDICAVPNKYTVQLLLLLLLVSPPNVHTEIVESHKTAELVFILVTGTEGCLPIVAGAISVVIAVIGGVSVRGAVVAVEMMMDEEEDEYARTGFGRSTESIVRVAADIEMA